MKRLLLIFILSLLVAALFEMDKRDDYSSTVIPKKNNNTLAIERSIKCSQAIKNGLVDVYFINKICGK